MNKKDSLGDRMKRYEAISKTTLMHRCPVIIRLDGKAFHTFTRGFAKPFDERLVQAMQETAKYLCKEVQGCVYGYTQSDEITLVLCDYQTLNTSAWFDYEVQKITPISASFTTLFFNRTFEKIVDKWWDSVIEKTNDENYKLYKTYKKAINKGAHFDSRCFNLPIDEVTNNIIWRQQDCTRNSIQMVGQYYFSHKELQNKSCNMIQDMLHEQYGINWNNYPIHLKRGTSVIKNELGKWVVDEEMPILTEDRDYIEKRIHF